MFGKLKKVNLICEKKFLPVFATWGAAGADLKCAILKKIHILPGQIVSIPTGVHIAIPKGYEGQIRSRSGLATSGIIVLNSPGTIDSDYRGEIFVLIINHGKREYIILPEQKIAQLVISRVERPVFNIAKTLNITARGGNGFGSTDRRSTPFQQVGYKKPAYVSVRDEYDEEYIRSVPPKDGTG